MPDSHDHYEDTTRYIEEGAPDVNEHDEAQVESFGDGDTLADSADYIKALYYGPKGRRKTTYMAGLARYAEAMGGKHKMLAIDTEGHGWLKRALVRHGIPVDRIVYRRCTTYNEIEGVFWEMEPRVESGEIVGVSVDHLSDLERRFVRAATMSRQTKKVGLGRVQTFTKAQDLIDKGVNPFETDRGDYNTWTNQATHLMRLYRDLDCHVAFGAHHREEDNTRKWVPGLTPAFRNELMGSVNMIVGCDLVEFGEEEEDIIGIGVMREMGLWYGADRIGLTKPKMVDPSMDRLIGLLNEELDLSKDSATLNFKKRLANG